MKKFLLILCILLTHLGLFACSLKKESSSPTSSTDSTRAGAELTDKIQVRSEPDQKILQFEPKAITELTLIRVDPTFEENFSYTFQKNGDKNLRAEDQWEIKTAAHFNQLKDRLANGNWIEHFLDTLTTLTAREIAGKAPLSHFGLDPPRYVIQIKTKSNPPTELHLGDPSGHSPSSRWGRLPRLEEARTQTMRYEGAAIQMLYLIRTPQFLRRERILINHADDIDIIQKMDRGKTAIKVEREGTDWVSQKTRKKVQSRMNQWLEAITHLRAERFIENESELKRIEELFHKKGKDKETITLHLTNRKDQTETLQILMESGKIWAQYSARPGVIFELHKDAIPTLRGP